MAQRVGAAWAESNDLKTVPLNTDQYFELNRTGSTLGVRVYNDSARTVLYYTNAYTTVGNPARYMYAYTSFDNGAGGDDDIYFTLDECMFYQLVNPTPTSALGAAQLPPAAPELTVVSPVNDTSYLDIGARRLRSRIR